MSFRLEHLCAPPHKFPAAATLLMNSSAPTANKLPPWIFYVLDAVLTAVAAYIAYHAPKPLSTQTILVVTALVLGGALLLTGVLVARYEREKNEVLDDRQRALEALARTLTTAAEQISIATTGLNDIADLTQKNLKKAEQLPAQLQEKVAELASRLATSEADTLDALENELASLRTSERERLAATAEKINQTVTQLGQLAITTHRNLTAAHESFAQLTAASTQHFAALDAATTAAIAQAQAAAAESLTGAHTRATAALGEKLSASLSAIDAKLAQLTTQLGHQVDSAATTLDTKLAALAAAANSLAAITVPKPVAIAPPPAEVPAISSADLPPEPVVSEVPKRSRKARREVLSVPVADNTVEPEPAAIAEPAPSTAVLPGLPAEPSAEAAVSASLSAEEPPVDSAPPTNAPVDIVTAAPFFFLSPVSPEPPPPAAEVTTLEPTPPAAVTTTPALTDETPAAIDPIPDESSAETSVPAPVPEASSAPAEPVAVESTTPEPTQPADEFVQFSPDELPATPAAAPAFKLHSPDATVSSMTADGATRLLATAYIGIGNRLFIRGEGPGLTWEKGVPLQFVSIGKWRWETTEAAAPIAFKLYKNDSTECTSLGEQSITPGHLTEVTAAF